MDMGCSLTITKILHCWATAATTHYHHVLASQAIHPTNLHTSYIRLISIRTFSHTALSHVWSSTILSCQQSIEQLTKDLFSHHQCSRFQKHALLDCRSAHHNLSPWLAFLETSSYALRIQFVHDLSHTPLSKHTEPPCLSIHLRLCCWR